MGIGLLHVKRRTRQKWRPIVTKFGIFQKICLQFYEK